MLYIYAAENNQKTFLIVICEIYMYAAENNQIDKHELSSARARACFLICDQICESCICESSCLF
jgi:hypothetical protein